MSPSRILGSVSLIVGGGVLLSRFIVGQDFLVEVTGTPMAILLSLSSLVFFLGILAVGLSIRDTRELTQDDQGMRQ